MSKHTPDKGSVEMHYVTGAVAANPGLTQIQACAEFARFLARVRREAKAEAWQEGADDLWLYWQSEGLRGREDNPYKEDPR